MHPDFFKDLFPDGDIPEAMLPERFEELKIKHKLILAQRKAKEELQQKLAKEEFDAAQIEKAKITYSDAIANEICERVSAGELLINICKDYHIPTIKAFNSWLKSHQEFATLFATAIQDRLSIFEEEVILIADDVTRDFKEVVIKNERKRVIDPEVISRAKLRIDVRFRHLKAGRPAKWSETSTLITKNDDADDPTSMSNEELEKRLADIDAKDKILKSVK
jgi:hypothetical protein